MKKSIVIFGGGGHAKVVLDVILSEGKFEVVGIVDSKFPVGSLWLDKYKIVSYDEAFQVKRGITAFGDNHLRKKIVEEIVAAQPGFEFITTIHPTATIGSQVKIGKGISIMPQTVINTYAEIGDHSIINTHATVEHDCMLGKFVFIAPGVTMGGNVKIGDLSMVGINASLKPGVAIGKNTIIGMGACLISDALDNSMYLGCPAKIKKVN